MTFQKVTDCLSILPLGMVNCYLYRATSGPVLIDCGNPGDGPAIMAALSAAGVSVTDVQIIATHLHIDHIGALPELQGAGAGAAHMHPIDAVMVSEGIRMRPMHFAGPFEWFAGSINRRMAVMPRGPQAAIIADATDGAILVGELTVIATPGHAAGQISLYSPRDGGVLITGDAAVRFTAQPNLSFLYEDKALAIESFQRIAELTFEHAVFGHGKPLVGGADRAFRRRAARLSR